MRTEEENLYKALDLLRDFVEVRFIQSNKELYQLIHGVLNFIEKIISRLVDLELKISALEEEIRGD